MGSESIKMIRPVSKPDEAPFGTRADEEETGTLFAPEATLPMG